MSLRLKSLVNFCSMDEELRSYVLALIISSELGNPIVKQADLDLLMNIKPLSLGKEIAAESWDNFQPLLNKVVGSLNFLSVETGGFTISMLCLHCDQVITLNFPDLPHPVVLVDHLFDTKNAYLCSRHKDLVIYEQATFDVITAAISGQIDAALNDDEGIDL